MKGRVIIGNGGAEMGVRGYVSAYDAATGQLDWRFYTVPGDPSRPFESAALERAAPTWSGEWWKFGGGGTVWDSMAYDPELDLLYIGVGNGSPWNQALRSPGGGDNLYLSSVVALRPESGEYVWHYQTTPGETWDYTATQHMILADLTLDGRLRRVLLQAPKNGFFYVLDRQTGELISAEPYTMINWASRVDLATGRPIENPAARYGNTGQLFVASPGPAGAHNWQPMSMSRNTGLVYIPVIDAAFPFAPVDSIEPSAIAWPTGIDFNILGLPPDEPAKSAVIAATRGRLAAWDPVAQREVWNVPFAEPWFGGVLSTAGDVVFQGTATGELVAYAARSGERLWAAPTQAGVLAPPISYQIDGEQYIALEVGWGGALALPPGELTAGKHARSNIPRVLAFKLDASGTLPAEPPPPPPPTASPLLPATDADASTLENGRLLYNLYCSNCHGSDAISSGVLPDLRESPALVDPAPWSSIVEDGVLESTGMVAFGEELTSNEIEQVRAYVISVARATLPAPQGR